MAIKNPFRSVYLLVPLQVLLFAYCLFGLYRSSLRATVPAVFSEENGKLIVEKLYPSQPGSALTPGDTIISVNGLLVSTLKEIEFTIDGLPIGGVVNFEVIRDSKLLNVNQVSIPYYRLSHHIIQFLVGYLFFFMGLFVLFKRPEDDAVFVFHWASVLVGLMIMWNPGRHSLDEFGVSNSFDLLFFLSGALVPMLFILFTFLFPRHKWSARKRLLVPLFSISVGLWLWMSSTFLLLVQKFSIENMHNFLLAYNFTRWFSILCLGFGVLNLLHSYFAAREESERRKLRWALLGLTIGPLCFVILWALPLLLANRPLVREEYALLTYTVIPVTFGISIIRYRLMDIDLIFNRSTVYAIVVAAVLAIYVLIVGAVTAVVGKFTLSPSLVVSIGAAIVVAILFEPLRNRVQQFVDRIFFRIRYDFRQAQLRFIEELKQCLDVQSLAELVVREVDQLLAVERIGFFTFSYPDVSVRLLSHRNFDLFDKYDVRFAVEKVLEDLRSPVGLSERIEVGVNIKLVNSELLQFWGAALALPILSHESEILGLLVLGEKKSGTRFSIEDLDLLHTVSYQVGLAIERITLQQNLILQRLEAQRLEELNRLKSHFVSSVSHDLKTPLTSIKMFVEILRTKKNIPAPEVREYLEIIDGESDRLARLINNVLDFAKIEQGVKEYHFARLKVNQVIDEVLHSLQYQFKMEGFELVYNLSPEDLTVKADKDALLEAIINLLSNAMKYSREVKKIAVSTFADGNYAVIKIEDKGVGIPKTELDRIFEPFYRVKGDSSEQIAGAGLGLSIVKHIVDAHGGKILAESTPLYGSSFSILLPLI